MSKNIKKWFETPIFPREEEKTEQARILNIAERYLFPLLALSAVALPFLTPTNERNAVLGIILVLFLLNSFSRFLLFGGYVEASGTVIAVSIWTVSIIVAALAGGISSPMMFCAVTIAIVFGLLLKQIVGIILIGMTILAGLGMMILSEYGIVIPRLFHFSDLGTWFVLVLCMFYLGLAVSYTLQRLGEALQQSQQKADETVVRSEAMFRAMFDNINDGMIFSDAEGLISFRSPTYQRIDGYTNAEWSRFKQFELVHPEDIDLVQRNWQAVLVDPAKPAQMEYRLRHKNETWVWVESVFQNLLNDPDVRSVVITTRKIHERKQAEIALRRSEAKFRAVIENSNDGILFFDADNRITYRSPSYTQLNGYTNEERMGRTGFDIIHPDDLEMLTEFWKKVINVPGMRAGIEYRIAHKNGSWIWVESTVRNLLNDPDIGAIVFATRDITERKHLEQAQAEEHAKLETLFDVLPVGISVIDEKRNVLKQNQALTKILKLDPEELAGGKHFERKYIRPDGTPMPESEFASSRVLQGEVSALNVETGVLIKDDKTIWISVSATQVPFSDWRIVVVTSDITERKQVELKLRESEERFRSLIEQSSEGIILTDESGRIIEWNQAQAKMTGISQDRAVGVPVWEMQYQLMLPEVRSRFSLETLRDGMQGAFINGTSPYLYKPLEYATEVGSGDCRILLQTSFPIKTENGYRLGNITRDVTENKRMEEKLHERSNYIETILENSPIGFSAHSTIDGTARYVSRRFAEIYDVPPDLLTSFDTFFHVVFHDPEFRDELRARVEDDLASGDPNRMRWENIPVDRGPKGIRYITGTMIPIPNQDLLVSTVQDVTEKVHSEQILKKYDEDVQRSALEERQRLARELHDSVGQVLGYVSFQTEAARELYASGKAEEADAQLMRLASIAQDAHADVREYILNLRTAPTSREPLFKTLQTYLDGFTRNYNIRTNLVLSERLDENVLDAKTQLNIFRIAQEALSNVRKHADARQVVVTFKLEGENAQMIIEDDGHGFDMELSPIDDKPHFGLSFMNERVNQLGGSIRFEHVHPSGTRVVVNIPITKDKPL